jgi:hypothetical protein
LRLIADLNLILNSPARKAVYATLASRGSFDKGEISTLSLKREPEWSEAVPLDSFAGICSLLRPYANRAMSI